MRPAAIAKLAFLLGLVFVTYLRFARPRVLDWNATEDEGRRPLPGDDILPAPAIQTTRAITIHAPPERIWPWLVQMGPRPRAGVYTYDWIERRLGIDIENADRLLSEFQHTEVGDFHELSPGQGLRVREVQPGRAIVLQWQPADSTWAFVLAPIPDEDAGPQRTRLLSRNRVQGHGLRFWLLMRLAMEPGSLVMERKMLHGIRDRAERTTAEDLAALAR